jgi:nitrate/nitrite-specific signal transduction histidine kinase
MVGKTDTGAVQRLVNVTADPETSDVHILLFEGVRELLFNAVKHARVDRVDVNLALGPGDTIQIQVSDEHSGLTRPLPPMTRINHRKVWGYSAFRSALH